MQNLFSRALFFFGGGRGSAKFQNLQGSPPLLLLHHDVSQSHAEQEGFALIQPGLSFGTGRGVWWTPRVYFATSFFLKGYGCKIDSGGAQISHLEDAAVACKAKKEESEQVGCSSP